MKVQLWIVPTDSVCVCLLSQLEGVRPLHGLSHNTAAALRLKTQASTDLT